LYKIRSLNKIGREEIKQYISMLQCILHGAPVTKVAWQIGRESEREIDKVLHAIADHSPHMLIKIKLYMLPKNMNCCVYSSMWFPTLLQKNVCRRAVDEIRNRMNSESDRNSFNTYQQA